MRTLTHEMLGGPCHLLVLQNAECAAYSLFCPLLDDPKRVMLGGLLRLLALQRVRVVLSHSTSIARLDGFRTNCAGHKFASQGCQGGNQASRTKLDRLIRFILCFAWPLCVPLFPS